MGDSKLRLKGPAFHSHMLFKKYNILLFRANGELLVSFRLRGWVLPAIFLVVCALIAGNVLLWPYFKSFTESQIALRELDRTINAQYEPVYRTAFDILALDKKYQRIKDLNVKLGIMLNLNERESIHASEDAANPIGSTERMPSVLDYASLLRLAHERYKQLHTSIRLEEVYQQDIIKEIVAQRDNLTRIPSIWPTKGRYTSKFGYRKHPISHRVQFHKGIDLATRIGTPVRAPASGVVSFADWFSSYGKTIDIDHGNGLSTRYGHLSKIFVKKGQKVTRGEIIGAVGNTGRSVAPHLHYEVHKNNRPVNPMYYIMSN